MNRPIRLRILILLVWTIALSPLAFAAPAESPTPSEEQLEKSARAKALRDREHERAEAEAGQRWVDSESSRSLLWAGPNGAQRGPITLPPRRRTRILAAGSSVNFDRDDIFYRVKARISKRLNQGEAIGLLEENGYQTALSPNLEYLGVLRSGSAAAIGDWDGQSDLPNHVEPEVELQRFEIYGSSGQRAAFDLGSGDEGNMRAMPALSNSGRYVAFYEGDAITLLNDGGEIVKRFAPGDGTGMRFSSQGDFLILARDGRLLSVYDAASRAWLHQAVSIPGAMESTAMTADVAGDRALVITDKDTGEETRFQAR